MYETLDLTKYSPTIWLVNGLIPQGDAALFLGKPHNGKSWVTEQLGICVASGKRFVDEFDVQQTSVILVDDDTPGGVLTQRLSRLAQGLGVDIDNIPLRVYSQKGFHLYNDIDRKWLLELIGDDHPLVILDSLEKIMIGVDLNRAATATQVGKYWNELKDAGATICVIHHMSLKKEVDFSQYDQTHLAIGSTRLIADSDTALCIFRTSNKDITEFVILPQERRTALGANRFSLILREDNAKTWARFVLAEELPRTPSKVARYVFPLFSDNSESFTMRGIAYKIKGGLSDNDIRAALVELEEEKVIVRGKEEHDRYVYSLNSGFNNKLSLTSTYWDVLRE